MFDSFCVTVIRNFGRNLKRGERNRKKHDGTGEESVEYLVEWLSSEDVHESEQLTLSADGLPCVLEFMHYFNILYTAKELPLEKNTIPIAANGECLVNVSIESKHPVLCYARYNPQTIMDWKTINEVTLPSRAKLFKDSVCYASTQGLYFRSQR